MDITLEAKLLAAHLPRLRKLRVNTYPPSSYLGIYLPGVSLESFNVQIDAATRMPIHSYIYSAFYIVAADAKVLAAIETAPLGIELRLP